MIDICYHKEYKGKSFAQTGGFCTLLMQERGEYFQEFMCVHCDSGDPTADRLAQQTRE